MIAAGTFLMLAGHPAAATPDYVAEANWSAMTFGEVFDSMVHMLGLAPERPRSPSYRPGCRLLTPQEAHVQGVLRSWGKTNAIREALGLPRRRA